MTTYWHMQIHPDDKSFADEFVYSILEHKKIIGLGEWEKGKDTINAFIQDVKVNDIVAIKNGAKLVALVQVIGGAYQIGDNSDIGWIVHRRPIRVLDWEIEEKYLPQPMGTLNRCASDSAETTQIIKNWHQRVIKSFERRKLDITV